MCVHGLGGEHCFQRGGRGVNSVQVGPANRKRLGASKLERAQDGGKEAQNEIKRQEENGGG